MIAFYLYAQFLLVSLSGDYDFKIMQILDQVEFGLNHIPVILVETLIGLDNLPVTHLPVTHCFTGSPILLEVYTHIFLTSPCFVDLVPGKTEVVGTPLEYY